jgi:hypothetical protein
MSVCKFVDSFRNVLYNYSVKGDTVEPVSTRHLSLNPVISTVTIGHFSIKRSVLTESGEFSSTVGRY